MFNMNFIKTHFLFFSSSALTDIWQFRLPQPYSVQIATNLFHELRRNEIEYLDMKLKMLEIFRSEPACSILINRNFHILSVWML